MTGNVKTVRDSKPAMKPQFQFEGTRELPPPKMRGLRSASHEMRATRFAAYLCFVRGRRCSTLAMGVRTRMRARTGAPMSLLRFSLYEARDLFIYIAYHEVLGMALM